MNYNKKIVLSVTAPSSVALIKGQPNFLAQHGFDVYIFCPVNEKVKEFARLEGCTIINIPFQREISLISDIKCLWLTYKNLRKINPDIINVGTPKAGLIGVVAGRLAGIKNRIFTLRGIRSTAMNDGVSKKVVRVMELITDFFATKVISITPSMAEYAINHGLLKRKKTVVLAKASSNGVNTSLFHPNHQQSRLVKDLRQEFGLSDNDFVIGFVGRVVKSKGVEEVYQSFRILCEKHSNIKLLVIGEIETTGDKVDSDILKSMKNDKNVILPGRRDDVAYCYQLMDIFTLPSHNFREGFGNVAIEASASGVPIVVSRDAGCQDAVIDGVSGQLVEPKNVNQLTEALELYIKEPSLIRIHGDAGFKYANDYFKNEYVWNAQAELYQTLLRS